MVLAQGIILLVNNELTNNKVIVSGAKHQYHWSKIFDTYHLVLMEDRISHSRRFLIASGRPFTKSKIQGELDRAKGNDHIQKQREKSNEGGCRGRGSSRGSRYVYYTCGLLQYVHMCRPWY